MGGRTDCGPRQSSRRRIRRADRFRRSAARLPRGDPWGICVGVGHGRSLRGVEVETAKCTLPQRDRNGAVLETREIASTEPDVPRDRNAMLLEAMKEELFQLELDRQRGKVSADEYATAKAALDQTIKRALTTSEPND